MKKILIILSLCIFAIFSCDKPKFTNLADSDVTIPAPTNLEIIQNTLSSCTLTWQDNSEGEEGFKIDRKKDNEDWVISYSTVSENTETFIETDLELGSTYRYRVYGYSGTNTSSTIESQIDIIFPAPTNLEIIQNSLSSCTLTWQDNSEGEEGFKIDRKKDNEDWVISYSTVSENTETFIETDLELGSTYQYRVYGYSGINTSSTIEFQIDIIFPAPKDFSLTIQNGTELHLSWSYPVSGIDGFALERKIDSGNWEILADLLATTFNYTDSYQPGSFYYYRIKAQYNNDYSPVSEEISYWNDLVFVEGGTFQMGDRFSEGLEGETPLHYVTLDDFYISATEVTQGEYEELMGNNPSDTNYGIGPNKPVNNLSWYDMIAYCNAKSTAEGLTPCYSGSGTNTVCDWNANGYRLPTEAEWEYAARGGSIGSPTGDRYSGCNEESDLPNYAWYNSNSGGGCKDVATKLPNQLGIYDMSGNVWEWCWDWYDSSYYGSSPSSNPHGANSGSLRVFRGGYWNISAYYCRVAYRSYSPSNSNYGIGFRLVRSSN